MQQMLTLPIPPQSYFQSSLGFIVWFFVVVVVIMF